MTPSAKTETVSPRLLENDGHAVAANGAAGIQPPDGTTATIGLDDLILDDDIQPRVRTDHRVIDAYAERIAAGDEFPPLDVFVDGEQKWVADGFQRHFAHRKAGRKEVECVIHEGTKAEAIWL